ncbi:hypothetical protein GCM10010493_31050 [Streptomyces lavendulae subsp. grasserius]
MTTSTHPAGSSTKGRLISAAAPAWWPVPVLGQGGIRWGWSTGAGARGARLPRCGAHAAHPAGRVRHGDPLTFVEVVEVARVPNYYLSPQPWDDAVRASTD